MQQLIKTLSAIMSLIWLITSSTSAIAALIKNPLQKQPDNISKQLVPGGKGYSQALDNAPSISENLMLPENDIFYHGGPVMGATSATIPNIYYIWYGNWSGNTAVNLLTNFALGIGKTAFYSSMTSYTNDTGTPIMRAVNFPKPGIFDSYSQGTALTDASVLSIVEKAITTNKLPLDPNGIYFVLSSSDVDETSGFCTIYCGWHDAATIQNQNIKYAFVGNSERCPAACSEQLVSPNNNLGADSMANIIAHELVETVTDPNLNAWYDNYGQENADKCVWQFGQTKKNANGAKYNMTIAFKNYLVQMNWLNANGGRCVNYL